MYSSDSPATGVEELRPVLINGELAISVPPTPLLQTVVVVVLFARCPDH